MSSAATACSICNCARVPALCTHSLLGMNATLKLQAGASEDYAVRSIGHSSFGSTLRHYVDPAVKSALVRGESTRCSSESAERLSVDRPHSLHLCHRSCTRFSKKKRHRYCKRGWCTGDRSAPSRQAAWLPLMLFTARPDAPQVLAESVHRHRSDRAVPLTVPALQATATWRP